jgi:hypothetical protein
MTCGGPADIMVALNAGMVSLCLFWVVARRPAAPHEREQTGAAEHSQTLTACWRRL